MHRGFVLCEKTGQVFFQIPSKEAKHGFYILDEDQAWDGGFGILSSWVALEEGDPRITPEDKDRLGWMIKESFDFESHKEGCNCGRLQCEEEA